MPRPRKTPLLVAEPPPALPRRRSRQGEKAPGRPFIKWAGGKRSILPAILERLGPVQGRYFEPFAGGGAVFFALAMRPEGLPGGAVLSDMNLRLVRTWKAIRDDLQGVAGLLAEHEQRHSEEWFYRVREDVPDDKSDAEVAAWLIYLNKAGFNGLYRVNRKGMFNVPYGKRDALRVLDLPNLELDHRLLQGVEIHHQDFEKTCLQAADGDTIYFDPPYVAIQKTGGKSFGAYTEDRFTDADQERLAQVAMKLKERGVRVLLSNHDTPGLRELYPPPFTIDRILAPRTVNSDATRRGGVPEVLIH